MVIPGKHRSLNYQLFKLFALELWRNKQGLALLVLMPGIFIFTALYTATDFKLPVRLYTVTGFIRLVLSQKQILLLYIAAAVMGFLCAYYAMVMFQESLPYFRFCSLMGMPPGNYLCIRLLFFVVLVGFFSLCITVLVSRLLPIAHPELVYLGYLFIGLIYGLYGAVIGTLSRNFFHSLLMIIMLTNLDVGWLQNPVFYSYADHTLLIRFLPAFFPCQFIFTSAYTNSVNPWCAVVSLLYAGGLFLILLLLLTLRFKGAGPGKAEYISLKGDC